MLIYRLGSGLLDHGPRLIEWAINAVAYPRNAPLSYVPPQSRLPRRGGR